MEDGSEALGGASQERHEVRTPCVLLVPTYNESQGIVPCLEAARHSALPPDFYWRRWIVVDDASVDGTPELVSQWASENKSVPIKLEQFKSRAGKQRALNLCHSGLVAANELDAVVVCCDADGEVEARCFTSLLGPMRVDPNLAIVSGVKLPLPYGFRQMASAFQMFALLELWRMIGQRAYRADSSIFAYRVRPLANFAWKPNKALDDVQLTDFAWRRELPVRSAWDAVIRVRPSGRFSDFYAQVARQARAGGTEQLPPQPSRRQHIAAALRTLRQRPVEGLAYAGYRMFAEIARRTRRSTFTDLWQISETTKNSARRP
jgi:glycosyltransferase involved in cell wall biosynthesis